ncbi:MAG: DUF1080 domain-containing protein [Bryobacteraceae bacterium]
MTPIRRRALVLGFSSLAAAQSPVYLETGFRPLWNGLDLSDFVVDTPSLWRVENGEIIGVSPGIRYNEFLRTRRAFSDFILKVKFKMSDPSGKANSGVQFRSADMPGSHEVIGYQADLGQQYWGCLYDESRRKRVLVEAAAGSLDGLDKAAWNEYTVTADGPRIKLELNGRTTVEYAESDPAIARDGFIALQLHAGPPLEMRFRDLRIRVLG